MVLLDRKRRRDQRRLLQNVRGSLFVIQEGRQPRSDRDDEALWDVKAVCPENSKELSGLIDKATRDEPLISVRLDEYTLTHRYVDPPLCHMLN